METEWRAPQPNLSKLGYFKGSKNRLLTVVIVILRLLNLHAAKSALCFQAKVHFVESSDLSRRVLCID